MSVLISALSFRALQPSVTFPGTTNMVLLGTWIRSSAIAALATTAALVVPAHAATVLNEFIPVEDTAFLPCLNGGAGETVDIQGTTHVVVIEEVIGSMRTARFFFNYQGVSGVGQITGTHYVVIAKNSAIVKTSLLHENVSATFTETLNFLGTGPDNKFFSQAQFHITVRPDGSVVLFRDSQRESCK